MQTSKSILSFCSLKKRRFLLITISEAKIRLIYNFRWIVLIEVSFEKLSWNRMICIWSQVVSSYFCSTLLLWNLWFTALEGFALLACRSFKSLAFLDFLIKSFGKVLLSYFEVLLFGKHSHFHFLLLHFVPVIQTRVLSLNFANKRVGW